MLITCRKCGKVGILHEATVEVTVAGQYVRGRCRSCGMGETVFTPAVPVVPRGVEPVIPEIVVEEPKLVIEEEIEESPELFELRKKLFKDV